MCFKISEFCINNKWVDGDKSWFERPFFLISFLLPPVNLTVLFFSLCYKIQILPFSSYLNKRYFNHPKFSEVNKKVQLLNIKSYCLLDILNIITYVEISWRARCRIDRNDAWLFFPWLWCFRARRSRKHSSWTCDPSSNTARLSSRRGIYVESELKSMPPVSTTCYLDTRHPLAMKTQSTRLVLSLRRTNQQA